MPKKRACDQAGYNNGEFGFIGPVLTGRHPQETSWFSAGGNDVLFFSGAGQRATESRGPEPRR